MYLTETTGQSSPSCEDYLSWHEMFREPGEASPDRTRLCELSNIAGTFCQSSVSASLQAIMISAQSSQGGEEALDK